MVSVIVFCFVVTVMYALLLRYKSNRINEIVQSDIENRRQSVAKKQAQDLREKEAIFNDE